MVRRRKSERGFALVAVAISATTLLAFLPLAIDVGRLAFTANEVQTVADVAATAGATYLLTGQDPPTARSQARAVVAKNSVDGSAATIPLDSDIKVGQYDPQTGKFTANIAPYSAVQATPSKTVSNLFAGIFVSSLQESTVTKTATAGFSGLGQAAPTLPLVIGICKFPSLLSCFATDGCLPQLDHAPTQDENAGWLKDFTAVCGSGPSAPTMSVGDMIGVSEGTTTPNLKAVQDCVKAGTHEFVVPIVDVPCGGQFNQTKKVLGFATIRIEQWTDVDPTGNSKDDPKGIKLHAIFKQSSGPVGGGAYGTGQMRLYN